MGNQADEKRQGEKQTQDHPSDGKTPERFVGSEKMYGESQSETVEVDHLMERQNQGTSGGDDGPRQTDTGGQQGDQPGAHSKEKHDEKKEGGKQ